MTVTERRHLCINGHRTTIAMEAIFWRGAELEAMRRDLTWQDWIAFQVDNKPAQTERTSWLRQRIYLAKY